MSSPQQSSFKFPKALAAAGLAAVLVGCGGGSESSSNTNSGDENPGTVLTPTPTTIPLSAVPGFAPKPEAFTLKPGTSQDLKSGDYYVSCALNGPECNVTVTVANGIRTVSYTGGELTYDTTLKADEAIANNDPVTGLAATHKKKIMGLHDDVLKAINTRSNYNVDVSGSRQDNPTATTVLTRLEAELGTTDSTKYLSAEDLKMYRDKVTEFRSLIASNAGSELLLDGIDKWNARVANVNSLAPSIIPGSNNTGTDLIMITDDFGEKTNIRAGGLVATSITAFKPSDIGPVWQGRDFQAAHQSGASSLKVFTTHEAGTNGKGVRSWKTFWEDNGHYNKVETFGTNGASQTPLSRTMRGASTITYEIVDSADGTNGDQLVATPQTPLSARRTSITEVPATDNVYIRIASTAQNVPSQVYSVGTIIGAAKTKIHRNDLQLNSAPNTPLNISSDTQNPTPITELTSLGGATNKHSTFLGQAGGFSCATSTDETQCGLAFDEDGFLEISILANNGTTALTAGNIVISLDFISDQPVGILRNTSVDFSRPDTTYMTMGYWLSADGTVIDTFASGRYWYDDRRGGNAFGLTTDASGNPNLGEVKGTATYTGQAVGAYVLNTPEPENNLDLVLHKGEFRADVNLNASFGTTASSTDGGFRVSGRVSDFSSLTNSNHNAAMSSNFGTLLLNETSTNNPGGSFRGSTTGNGVATMNAWQGQFYGNTGRETITTADNFPDAAVGEFKGDFGNENKVVGVFGVD